GRRPAAPPAAGDRLGPSRRGAGRGLSGGATAGRRAAAPALPRGGRARPAVPVTLQYTAGNTQHFAEWYQRELAGAFHASHQDGNLRLDYTQHALGALLHYLTYVAEIP